MTPEFNAADPSTWPAMLIDGQVAAIYQRSVSALKKAVQEHRFIPAPKIGRDGQYERPLRWRKVDVLRDVEPQRMPSIGHFRRKAS